MMYNKNFITCLIIFMIGNIYAQDYIINEIAKGGKFIVRDDAQNEAMVIEDNNVGFSGTLKLGVLPDGDISNSIVVWDPNDQLLKLQDPAASSGSTLWTESGSNLYRTSGNIGIGTTNPSVRLDVAGQVKISGGTPGLGKVLTSDATGLATWQAPASGESTLWTESGSNVYRTSGNVGIGTANPSVRLDVAGQVKITGGTPGLGKVLTSDATGLATWQTPSTGGGSTLWTESGSNLYRAGGNIGIGTANPSVRLDVAGQVKISGGTPGLGKVLTSDATGLATWQTPASGGSTLWTESGSNLYRTSGNVGIGTSTPAFGLDLKGNFRIISSGDNDGHFQFNVVDGDEAHFIMNNGNNFGLIAKSDVNSPKIGTYTGGSLQIYPYSDLTTLDATKGALTTFDFENMNVGIGTSNPSAKLDIAGQVKITGGTPGAGKVLTSDATGLATWQAPSTGGGSTLWTESESNVYRTNGNIGIGTANPNAKLDVNGTVTAKRYVSNGLNIISNGVWDLSQGNIAQITYNSSITPITISSDGSAGTYVLVVKKNSNCTDCTLTFLWAAVKYPDGVSPTLSNGTNTTDVFSFIAVGNNTFYCLYAKNLL